MKVLIVGPDTAVPKTLEYRLKRKEFLTERIVSAEDAQSAVRDFGQSLIILGLDDDTLNESFLKFLRKHKKISSPVLILSPEVTKTALLAAFELGCDDYQQSDCEGEVLVARIKALIRRANGQADNIIQAGKVKINLTTHLVTVDGEAKKITSLSYRMLILFCMRKTMTLSRNTLMNELYGSDAAPLERTIDVHVGRLRRLLGDDVHIETLRGDGYRMLD